jgi:hypothetical protein
MLVVFSKVYVSFKSGLFSLCAALLVSLRDSKIQLKQNITENKKENKRKQKKTKENITKQKKT